MSGSGAPGAGAPGSGGFEQDASAQSTKVAAARA
jgi:hypothetical protein